MVAYSIYIIAYMLVTIYMELEHTIKAATILLYQLKQAKQSLLLFKLLAQQKHISADD
jgi:hypothetical protein